jgi:hypothetical protein
VHALPPVAGIRFPFRDETTPAQRPNTGARPATQDDAVRIRNPKDFYAGLLFMAFGAAFMWGATYYSMGTAARMGPGYFPVVLGGVLIGLGALIFLNGLAPTSEDGRIGAFHFKPAVLVLGGIAAFALLLRTVGFVAAILAIILVSSLASPESRLKESLLSAIVLCLASLAIFVYGLNLQFPVWPPFMLR